MRECPIGHDKDATWCLDCKYAKEGLCDYPYVILPTKAPSPEVK
jgi:hypothetical protein